MKIFLTGATGFIGQHIVQDLCQSHEVTCLVRPHQVSEMESKKYPGVKCIAGNFTQPQEWVEEIAGHDIVINAIGIIRETATAKFSSVHAEAPIAMFTKAKELGVKKIIQISALGSDEEAAAPYHLTKKAADDYLEKLGVGFVILRPSLVYGPQDHSMTFFSSLAALPVTMIPGDGQYKMQPVHVGDLTKAVRLAVENPKICDAKLDVGGEDPVTFDEMFDILARWLGKKQACKVHVLWGIMKFAAKFADICGRGPINSDELSMLRRGNWSDSQEFSKVFGFTPTSFATMMQRTPPDQGKLWYCYLKFLRIPLRISIAFIWLMTAFVCAFVYPQEESLKLLYRINVPEELTRYIFQGTLYFEFVLGTLILFGFRPQLLGKIQLLMVCGFTVILSWGLPEFWWHPFGPVSKNIPLIGAILVHMAIERETKSPRKF